MNIKKILLLIIVGIIVLTGTILYFYRLSFGKFSRTFIYDKTSINEIYIDDRATKALQITTIIHELSHFLLAEILEQIISIILSNDISIVLGTFTL